VAGDQANVAKHDQGFGVTPGGEDQESYDYHP
jgi:hypothetical protein